MSRNVLSSSHGKRLISSSVVVTAVLMLILQECHAWTTTITKRSSSTTTTTSRWRRHKGDTSVSIINLHSTKMYIDHPTIRTIQEKLSSIFSRRRHPTSTTFIPQQPPTIPTISNYQADQSTLLLQPKSQHHPIAASKLHNTATTTTTTKTTHGMPWKQSISQQYNIDHAAEAATTKTTNNNNLLYMKFYEWQMSYMEKSLTNLQPLPVVSKQSSHKRDMSYIQNKNSTVRMYTSAYNSDEYEYIRCTIVDGGHQIQVFTSLFYPRNTLLPVLGIDLLQFNHGKKTLCIVDFQPIVVVPIDESTTTTTTQQQQQHPQHHTMNSEYYESKLQRIRDQYPSLQNEMTNRFYSVDDPYFSKQMLLGRVQYDSKSGHSIQETQAVTHQMVNNDLYPAYQQYLQTHVELQKELQQQQQQSQLPSQLPSIRTTMQQYVQECHARYDTYSAQRDPAHKLLGNIFGHDFADDYVYDILFPSAIRDI